MGKFEIDYEGIDIANIENLLAAVQTYKDNIGTANGLISGGCDPGLAQKIKTKLADINETNVNTIITVLGEVTDSIATLKRETQKNRDDLYDFIDHIPTPDSKGNANDISYIQ